MNLAIVGATGVVGTTVLQVMSERNMNFENLYLFCSSKSADKKIVYNGKIIKTIELKEDSFNNKNIDYAIFCAGSEISKNYVEIAAKNNVTVIDNSSYFRMKKDVPLVVPEINGESIKGSKIIANPNCSTIQSVMALSALHKELKIKRVIYTTFQAVSGAGKKGIDELQNKNINAFKYKIENNCIPQIDVFDINGYTKEELKMIDETRKIFGDDSIQVTATCVRVPIINCHSVSINVEFENDFNIDDVFRIMRESECVLCDDTENFIYPMPIIANNKDEVFVGRLRQDLSHKNTLNMFVVADNLRKGAATNAIQILQYLIKNNC